MKRIAIAFALFCASTASAQSNNAYRVGVGVQITPRASCATAVSKAAGSGLLCIDSSASNVLKYKNPAGTTITLGSGGGGSTLAASYDVATPASNTITTATAGGPFKVLQGTGPSPFFQVTNSAAVNLISAASGTLTLGSATYTASSTSWSIAAGTGTAAMEINKGLGVRDDAVGATIGGGLGLYVANYTNATSGNQKYSPWVIWRANGYDVDNTTTRAYEIMAQVVPTQGNIVGGSLNFYSAVALGSWSAPLFSIGDTFTTAGKPIIPGFTTDTITPTWIAVSGGIGFTNSYVNIGGAYAGSAYWKDATGNTHVYVAVSTGTSGTSPFTLPAGYRPGRRIVFGCYVGTTVGYATANTDGTFTPAVGNSSTGFIGYVTFPAEQ